MIWTLAASSRFAYSFVCSIATDCVSKAANSLDLNVSKTTNSLDRNILFYSDPAIK